MRRSMEYVSFPLPYPLHGKVEPGDSVVLATGSYILE